MSKELVTAGEMIVLLQQIKPNTPVILNVNIPGDGRKKHLPWVTDLWLSIDHCHYINKTAVIIHGTQNEN